MRKSSYNSLTEKLIQNGIIPNDNEVLNENFFENLNQKKEDNTPQEQQTSEINGNKKRINQYDLDLIKNNKLSAKETINFKITATLKLLSCILGFGVENSEKIDNFFEKFFPRLYRAKKLRENISYLAKYCNVKDKTIPYGEQEERYNNLVKYLSYANNIETKIKEKI